MGSSLAAALGPTLAFIAAILAAWFNARANRKQAEKQAELDRKAAKYGKELEREYAERIRIDEAAAMAQTLLGEVSVCTTTAETILLFEDENVDEEQRAILLMMELNFPTKAYEAFLQRVGLLGNATTSLAYFYSKVLSTQQVTEKARRISMRSDHDLKQVLGGDVEKARVLPHVFLENELRMICERAKQVKTLGLSLQEELRRITARPSADLGTWTGGPRHCG